MARERGKVKWFDSKKGYGFICPASGGKDVFVHHTGIEADGYRSLEDGQEVVFERETADRGELAVKVAKA